jgi:hypothetical protein
MTIIPLKPVEETEAKDPFIRDAVEYLEEMIRRVRAGECVSLAVASINRDRSASVRWYNPSKSKYDALLPFAIGQLQHDWFAATSEANRSMLGPEADDDE